MFVCAYNRSYVADFIDNNIQFTTRTEQPVKAFSFYIRAS